MPTLWIRSAKVAPILMFNRHTNAGLLNKTSEAFLGGTRFYTRYVNFKDFGPLQNKGFYGYPMYGVRAFSEKAAGSVPPSSPPPTPPNLPDRAQIERAFFRVVAFFWDYGFWLFAWSRKMIKLHVVEKPAVQLYWKRFHEKMEEAKKDT